MRRSLFAVAIAVTVTLSVSLPTLAEFPGTDVMLPVVARIQGSGNPPPQFYSTVWFTDLSTTTSASVQLQFYQRGSSTNPTATASLTLSPGETRRIDDAVTTFFQLSGVAGSLRVISTEDVLVSTRNYDLPAGGTEKDTTGQYFGAIPVDFAIGSGEVTQLQGVEQTTEARYNFGAVEITGQTVTLQATLLNPDGSTVGSKSYPLPAYGQMQANVTDITQAINGVGNALLVISVTSGNGKILAYGTHNTNVSQDGTGFEMAFKQSLLSGSGGLSAVNHDASLKGDGTAPNPLGIANGGVGTTQLADSAVTKGKLSPTGGTAGQVLGTDGTNLIWQPDGLTLPYAGTASSTLPVISATNTGGAAGLAGTGGLVGVEGLSSAGFGVGGISQKGIGALGVNADGGVPSPFPAAGVVGTSSGSVSFGVFGVSDAGLGVLGVSGRIDPSLLAAPPAVGIYGTSDSSDGVFGTTTGTETYGVHGESAYEGVFGENPSAKTNGCLGCFTAGAVGYTTDASLYGVIASNVSGGVGIWGNSTSVSGVTGPGVQGTSASGNGVVGLSSTGDGVYGQNQATHADGCVGCPTAGIIGYQGASSYAGQFTGNVLVSSLASSGFQAVYATSNGVLALPVSDARLKKNIVDLSQRIDPLDAVRRLRGVTFNYDTSTERACLLGDQPEIGLIAQEVEAVLPELVATDKEGYKSLDYAKLTPVLVEAMKEQEATIEAQQATLDGQRSELDRVTERVVRLEALLAEITKRVPDPMPSR